MKATIKCYQTNADVFYGDNVYSFNWDGYEWENEQEWQEWADEQLEPISDADNYMDIEEVLRIHTDHRIH